MNINNTNEFVLALCRLKGWGPSKVADYVLRHGIDFEQCKEFLKLELTGKELIEFSNNLISVRADLEANNSKHINFIDLFDKRFPRRLYDTNEPVIYLYYVGDIDLLSSKCITIIGTRNPDQSFIDSGRTMADFFSKQHITIVSGLALGCDTIAHQSALDSNCPTIAVLPSALNNVVPAQNRELARNIVKSGGLVISEYSVLSKMNKFNYPQRDRIQSLLSNVIIIIQSTDDGGTMIAAKKSLKDKKIVYALAGNHLELIDLYIDPHDKESLTKLMDSI